MTLVRLTERAGALLQRMQADGQFRNPLRVVEESDSFIVGMTEPATDDEVLFHEGVPVLRLSAAAAKALTGSTIASRDTATGEDLAIFGPGETVDE
jgi:hypothetical protein